MAHGSDPSPPASLTAIAISVPLAPAIGAWMIGSSVPRRSSSARLGHISFVLIEPRLEA